MLNTLSDIAMYTELSIGGTFDDQTRLILINTATQSYVKLRGSDAIYDRLQHAVKLATNKSWENFYRVASWAIDELKELSSVEDFPGQAIQG